MTTLVLGPLLGIKDLRASDNIDFVGGIRGYGELEKRCEKDCVAAFAMHPVEIDELLKIADAGMVMPPKSTWFEPKCRDGLVVKCFDWLISISFILYVNFNKNFALIIYKIDLRSR